MRLIDAAEQQWALEQHQGVASTPQGTDLQPYLGHGSNGELPTCPADSSATPTFGSSYVVNAVGVKPTCAQVPATHILP